MGLSFSKRVKSCCISWVCCGVAVNPRLVCTAKSRSCCLSLGRALAAPKPKAAEPQVDVESNSRDKRSVNIFIFCASEAALGFPFGVVCGQNSWMMKNTRGDYGADLTDCEYGSVHGRMRWSPSPV